MSVYLQRGRELGLVEVTLLCVLGVPKGLVYSKLFWLFDVFCV